MTQDETDNPLLKSLAQRLEADPRFMAYALAQYRRQEGIGVEELAQSLGMMPEMMARLALCLRPDSRSRRSLPRRSARSLITPWWMRRNWRISCARSAVWKSWAASGKRPPQTTLRKRAPR